MNTSTLSLTIQLPKFEGPLALLLYLIRKEEMDIFDIEIHRITAQYLEFIRLMKELDLEVAGEFIAMASTLIQIKSRMLLPQYNEQGEIVDSEDPRKELVQRLLEYQKYQEVGKSLYERPLLGRDVWTRGRREKFEERILEEIELEENALYSLITSYRRAFKAAAKRVHKVSAKTQSIASRIMQIKDRLIMGIRVAMSSLTENGVSGDEKRRQILITFLSTLELAKMGFVRLFQSDTYQEIHIETVKVIEAAAVSQVEEYESLHNDEGNAAAALEPLRMDSVPEEEPGAVQLSLLDQPLAAVDEVGLEDFILHEAAEGAGDELILPDEIASDDEILAAELELDGVVLTAEPVHLPATELIDPNLDALDFVTTVSDLEAEVQVAFAESNSENLQFTGELSEDSVAEVSETLPTAEPELLANVESVQLSPAGATVMDAASAAGVFNFAGLGAESDADLDLAPEDLKKNEGKTDVEI
jgi:segregation and condensation protein A